MAAPWAQGSPTQPGGTSCPPPRQAVAPGQPRRSAASAGMRAPAPQPRRRGSTGHAPPADPQLAVWRRGLEEPPPPRPSQAKQPRVARHAATAVYRRPVSPQAQMQLRSQQHVQPQPRRMGISVLAVQPPPPVILTARSRSVPRVDAVYSHDQQSGRHSAPRSRSQTPRNSAWLRGLTTSPGRRSPGSPMVRRGWSPGRMSGGFSSPGSYGADLTSSVLGPPAAGRRAPPPAPPPVRPPPRDREEIWVPLRHNEGSLYVSVESPDGAATDVPLSAESAAAILQHWCAGPFAAGKVRKRDLVDRREAVTRAQRAKALYVHMRGQRGDADSGEVAAQLQDQLYDALVRQCDVVTGLSDDLDTATQQLRGTQAAAEGLHKPLAEAQRRVVSLEKQVTDLRRQLNVLQAEAAQPERRVINSQVAALAPVSDDVGSPPPGAGRSPRRGGGGSPVRGGSPTGGSPAAGSGGSPLRPRPGWSGQGCSPRHSHSRSASQSPRSVHSGTGPRSPGSGRCSVQSSPRPAALARLSEAFESPPPHEPAAGPAPRRDEHEAATRIQAVHRGYVVRRQSTGSAG
eukprot:TRINITY_DN16451_c0_g1_i2.p1 TRINITY_DN16451_c0_g1~~TRINITY_DN16451_c0_g1_i2.p1  ORF type:complete len:592 (+),score=128.79 TRINITY_DN16451_c0_g1_i2:65-1777(+)